MSSSATSITSTPRKSRRTRTIRRTPNSARNLDRAACIESTADGKIENTGPLNTKRMETIDEEFLAAAKDFINRQHRANKPWFCYFNSTRMHIFTHLKEESQGKTGLGLYPDGMVEHDGWSASC